jgi:hypothetical protein
MKHNLLKVTLNFSAVVLLLALIITPIYFATNFAQVSGVKSQSNYLLVSQIDKFPGMTFSQSGQNYTINFTKQATSQAYLALFIINNPTNGAKTYKIMSNNSKNTLFFGEDLKNQLNKINIPAQSSAPISLLSESPSDVQTVTFQMSSD